MEYGNLIDTDTTQVGLSQRADKYIGDLYNDSYNQNVLYDQNATPQLNYLFSNENIDNVGAQVAELLKCLRKDGRPILITRAVIAQVLSQIEQTATRQAGDMYTLLHIPQEYARDDIGRFNAMTVEYLYNQINTEYEMI